MFHWFFNILGLCWEYYGSNLTKSRQNFGIVLGIFWRYCGTILATSLDYSDTFLEVYWEHSGITLQVLWAYFGSILDIFRQCFRIILGAFWMYSGARRIIHDFLLRFAATQTQPYNRRQLISSCSDVFQFSELLY